MSAGGAARAQETPRRRTIVKVCGITRLQDARASLEAGADWLGFVIWSGSPRAIEAERAREIVAALEGVTAVAVLVAPDPDHALATASRIGAARVQLHRVDPASWPAGFPIPVTFVVPVGADGAVAGALPDERNLIMLDTVDAERVGGTGVAHDWRAAAELAARRDVMLAGGLDGANVAAALERVRPYGVDASSRLEREPGIKDAGKVRRYVDAVRAWEAGAVAGRR
jgi:phosphoribosylanthranilate isomerase